VAGQMCIGWDDLLKIELAEWARKDADLLKVIDADLLDVELAEWALKDADLLKIELAELGAADWDLGFSADEPAGLNSDGGGGGRPDKLARRGCRGRTRKARCKKYGKRHS
jgi:hypothetical protein